MNRDTCLRLARLLAFTAPLLGAPALVHAQATPLPAWADSFVVIAPGAQYARGGLLRLLLGGHNRDLWATKIRVPVINLQRYAGGLTELLAHSGSQTKSVRFQGADGRTYQFRSVDKDPTALLAPELQRTAVAKTLQDGVSSSQPVGSLIASALLQAAGVLHVDQTLAVLPDDPALGDARKDFAGVFGMMEVRPDENDDESAAFAGARRVISPTRLFERIRPQSRRSRGCARIPCREAHGHLHG